MSTTIANHASYAEILRRLLAGESIQGRELLKLRGLRQRRLLRPGRRYGLEAHSVVECIIDSALRLANEINGDVDLTVCYLHLQVAKQVEGVALAECPIARAAFFEIGSAADLAAGLGYDAESIFQKNRVAQDY
jgi:hypothetical protein